VGVLEQDAEEDTGPREAGEIYIMKSFIIRWGLISLWLHKEKNKLRD
jgi:hypothetical protein